MPHGSVWLPEVAGDAPGAAPLEASRLDVALSRLAPSGLEDRTA